MGHVSTNGNSTLSHPSETVPTNVIKSTISSNQLPDYIPINNLQPTYNNTLITTTTNVILDYLLFLSINTRIDQTKNELINDATENKQLLHSFNNKKGQGVEAIVEGLLRSHRAQAPSVLLPLPLKHRLYLCQLLHLVFDRSNIAISELPMKSSQVIQDSTNASRQISPLKPIAETNTSNMACTMNMSNTKIINISPQKQRSQKLPTNLAKYEKHFKYALLSRCRKHRQSVCTACQQDPSNSSITPPMTRRRSTLPKPIPTRRSAPGLIDAIPVFLDTCAITCRLAHDNESMTVKPMWYELLLDLLTQAAIECYLCDSYKSIDVLLEIFSYGDIDPSDYHSDDSESDDDVDPQFAATRADDYLLWQRTAYLDEFRRKKKDRMEEFLNVKGKLEQHFENLAKKYPIKNFETEMLNYCADVTESLESPALITGLKTSKINDEELFHIPGRYNGGIDIPMIDDIDDDYIVNVDVNYYNYNGNSKKNDMGGKKRRLSECEKPNEMIKKTKNEGMTSL